MNEWSYSRKRFSIVSTCDDYKRAEIIVKGPATSMKSVLELN